MRLLLDTIAGVARRGKGYNWHPWVQFIFVHKSLRLAERKGESEPPEEKSILDGQFDADAAHPAPEEASSRNMLQVCCILQHNFEKFPIAQLSCVPSPGFF